MMGQEHSRLLTAVKHLIEMTGGKCGEHYNFNMKELLAEEKP
jgi:hypothetical protein